MGQQTGIQDTKSTFKNKIILKTKINKLNFISKSADKEKKRTIKNKQYCDFNMMIFMFFTPH